MNSLGTWIRATRLDKGWDIEALAKISGVAKAQISRIETANSDITVGSMIRLAYGLDLNILDVLSASQNLSTFPRFFNSRSLRENEIVLKIDDLDAFFNFYRGEPDRAKETLITGYQAVLDATTVSNTEKVSEFKTAEIIYEATQALSDKYLPLPYPKGISTDQIDEIYTGGGIITNRDLGAYIRGCRKTFGISLRNLAKEMNFSYISIARLEKAETNRISFSEIMKMDKAMQLDGRLIAICWAAGEFQTGVVRNRLAETRNEIDDAPPKGWGPQEMALADTLITISRWHQTLTLRSIDWMQTIMHCLSVYKD